MKKRSGFVADLVGRLAVRLTAVLLVGLVVEMAGCASSPHSSSQAAYDVYWRCASHAVRPYVGRRELSSREAAMRAQAHCNAAYQQYRAARINEVRRKLARDNYDMADQLGAQQALVWRRRVTRALDDYVSHTRAGA